MDAWVLGPKLMKVPTGLSSATCRPCTKSPLKSSPPIPDRVTAVGQLQIKMTKQSALNFQPRAYEIFGLSSSSVERLTKLHVSLT